MMCVGLTASSAIWAGVILLLAPLYPWRSVGYARRLAASASVLGALAVLFVAATPAAALYATGETKNVEQNQCSSIIWI